MKWAEFAAGPQMLEALNAGAIDIAQTGEAPPIFAQAASDRLVYIAHEPPAPHGEAILVPKDSPIQSVADLKGRKVGLNKGSNVHFLLVKALESAGVGYDQIETAFLPPADARAAFASGADRRLGDLGSLPSLGRADPGRPRPDRRPRASPPTTSSISASGASSPPTPR